MSDDELVEKMAEAINASSAAALPWAKLIDEAAQYPYSETWVRFCRDAARAALAVAEPVIRERCAVEADTCDSPWASATQEQDQAAAEMADRIAHAIRAGGTP